MGRHEVFYYCRLVLAHFQGGRVVLGQVGACDFGGWCLHLVGAIKLYYGMGASFHWVLVN